MNEYPFGSVEDREMLAEMPIEKLLQKLDELKKPTEEAAEVAVKPMRMFSALISGMSRRQHMIEQYTLRRIPAERRSLINSVSFSVVALHIRPFPKKTLPSRTSSAHSISQGEKPNEAKKSLA